MEGDDPLEATLLNAPPEEGETPTSPPPGGEPWLGLWDWGLRSSLVWPMPAENSVGDRRVEEDEEEMGSMIACNDAGSRDGGPGSPARPPGEGSRGRVGLAASMFKLTSVTLGVGTLAVPYAFRSTGRARGMGLLTVAFLGSAFSADMLCEAALELRLDAAGATYGGLVDKAFGRRGGVIVRLVVAVATFAMGVVYFQLVGDLVAPLAAYYLGDSPADYCSPWAHRLVPMCFFLAVELGLCVLPAGLAMRHVTPFATASVVYLIVVVASACAAETGRVTEFGPDDLTLGILFRAAGLFVFALAPHLQIVPLLSELECPTPLRCRVLVWGSLAGCFAVYAAVGVLGNTAFGGATHGDVLLNLSPADAKVTAARLWLAVSIAAGFPTLCAPFAATVDRACCSTRAASDKRRLAWVGLYLGGTFCLAFFYDNLSLFMSLSGAGPVAVGSLFLPAVLYMFAFKNSRGFRAFRVSCAWFVVVLSLFAGSLALAAGVEALVHPPGGPCRWPSNCPDVRCCPAAGPRYDPPIPGDELCPTLRRPVWSDTPAPAP
ncbi:Vacuolar amino acid transporter 7 [Diplonema papillatum]|nr:Vacuolar amino acid transporter 7 [Diplonema papillatum]